MVNKTGYVLWFKDVGKEDISLVGGKGANLGEMVNTGFPVPNGFIVSSHAYFQFIKQNNLTTKIKHILASVDYNRPESLLHASAQIKKQIMQGEMSEAVIEDIFSAYKQLGATLKDAFVAIRSSATAEDLPGASFAGQQETFLNIQGEANVVLKVKEAWASLFEARAIFYRHEKDFSHFRVGIAIVVQKMIESEQSGIMFTLDPVTNDKSKIVIEAIYGLGEYIVQGHVTPDHYEVHKKDLLILKKTKANQQVMLTKSGGKNKDVKLTNDRGSQQKITDKQILALAELGRKLEHHYYFPQDSEWAIEKDKIFIVQTRPVTTVDNKKSQTSDQQKLSHSSAHMDIIAQGAPASPGIAAGVVTILLSVKDIGRVKPGEILVAPQTNPDYVPAMKKAAAILTERGGRTSHAAIVSRELGIPAIVGIEHITKKVKHGQVVTVNGTKGEVYKGGLQLTHDKQTVVHSDTKTATKLYVNLAQPELVEKVAQQNIEGIGLLRAEFMIANIGTHPKKLIHDGKRQVFIKQLAEQMEVFVKAFNPRPVIYRATDFKTNEYSGLVGGKAYEPMEPNPMLGYRGAFRYMHDPEVFQLELEAIKLLRNKHNLKNIWLMVPFVRTVRELLEVKKIIAAAGLHRSPTFKLWMMVEIPSNVILLDKFIETGIDGISIGSNDLTMLLLGTDRDNEEVAPEYDELNDAVLWAYEKIIKTAQKHKVPVSICGQAPSLYPSLVEKLITWGISSISVSPDVIDSTHETIAEVERKLISKSRRV